MEKLVKKFLKRFFIALCVNFMHSMALGAFCLGLSVIQKKPSVLLLPVLNSFGFHLWGLWLFYPRSDPNIDALRIKNERDPIPTSVVQAYLAGYISAKFLEVSVFILFAMFLTNQKLFPQDTETEETLVAGLNLKDLRILFSLNALMGFLQCIFTVRYGSLLINATSLIARADKITSQDILRTYGDIMSPVVYFGGADFGPNAEISSTHGNPKPGSYFKDNTSVYTFKF